MMKVNSTKELGTFSDVKASQLALMHYTKTACGVDFLLNTADSTEKAPWFHIKKRYITDFFEFYFFRKAEGYMLLNGERIDLHDGMQAHHLTLSAARVAYGEGYAGIYF